MQNDSNDITNFLARALRASLEGKSVNPFAQWMLSDAWTTAPNPALSYIRGVRDGVLIGMPGYGGSECHGEIAVMCPCVVYCTCLGGQS